MYAPQYNMRALYKKSDCIILKILLVHFDQLFRNFLPQLYTHMSDLGVDASMYASQWFCTLFAYRFDPQFTAIVWDRFLQDGMMTIFQTGLGLMTTLKDQMMKMPFEQIIPLLNHMTTPSLDVIEKGKEMKISEEAIYKLMTL